MIDDLEFRIARLDLRPGDVLVVKVNGPAISGETATAVRRMVNVTIPDHKVLVLDERLDLAVLTQAEIAARL